MRIRTVAILSCCILIVSALGLTLVVCNSKSVAVRGFFSGVDGGPRSAAPHMGNGISSFGGSVVATDEPLAAHSVGVKDGLSPDFSSGSKVVTVWDRRQSNGYSPRLVGLDKDSNAAFRDFNPPSWPSRDAGPGAIGGGARPFDASVTRATLRQGLPIAFLIDSQHGNGVPFSVVERGDVPMDAVFMPRSGSTCRLDGQPIVPGQRYPVNGHSRVESTGVVGVELSPSVALNRPSGNG